MQQVHPRVLVSAYACGPGDEPEAAAGWAFARAAARSHQVHVITRHRFAPAVAAELARDPELARNLTVEYLDLSARVLALKRRGSDVYWYYMLWQRALARRATELHRAAPYDVGHHVTFANDWLPCGLARVQDLPVVWGPVGGASAVPSHLVRWLGLRGTITELLRGLLTAPLRAVWGDAAARRATVVVAQNETVARRFRRAGHVVVEPNAALDDELPQQARPPRPELAQDPLRAVFVGRLLAWKGGRLAIETLARTPGWDLHVYGTGYEGPALERLAGRRGVSHRVVFHGHRPRAEVLDAIAGCDAMLFPSMHDQAGWVAAEASALGRPVVCLPLGGVPLLAGPNARPAALTGDVVGHLAMRLAEAATEPGTPSDRWSVSRLPDVVEGLYRTARSGSPAAKGSPV
ncbi:Glycosyltransferase involved in cell wall bisynthesis [Promicromonospora umidemergens]|uniref:Glycosyl transferase family 1 domain-containing protein n=1 Tax=Promicromonospora umidemergens TaxID=629679 RepID=A0ABP8Y859_9MICO|nr:glycosyltransferase family 4 protein [Promicromonospora umidemergens]MCP2282574.1 Glycosyltransferase involved in cell wall bisynthesis [Promicromonospora umidemergens]